MSDQIARAAISRMHMREVAVAAHYTGMAHDLSLLAQSDKSRYEAHMQAMHLDLCAAYGLSVETQQRKPFAFSGGMAIIPIHGSLINRFGQSWGYVTGYNFVRSQLAQAMADDDVKGIVFDVNSYGGEVAGCFELAADMREARSKKPTMAMVDSNAYSAGYALASSAGKIVVTPSGGVGSVGVVAMHVDQSKMLEKFGITVTLLYEAEHKVDGNPFAPLPDSVRKDVMAGISKSYETFVALVAENLGMDAQKVRDTKSRTYRADEALSLGLIHAILPPSQAVAAFFGELSGSTSQLRQGANMTTAQTQPGAATQTAPTQQPAAPAAAAPAAATGPTAEQAAQEARAAERARVSGILGSEEAKGRESLANHLAMNTGLSVDEAKAMLAAAPKAAAAAPAAPGATSTFHQAMAATAQPGVGADAAAAAPGEAQDPVAAILRDQASATGVKLDK